jgi:hypothetical protein
MLVNQAMLQVNINNKHRAIDTKECRAWERHLVAFVC